ncbi:MAG: hypothetical protein H6559_20035 [Lewinellaceae bacterium]|nr:hypothetical protein [Lewinellaceae bacterium]
MRERQSGFYNTIAGYEADVHHIAYHPSVPYSSCIFYQANTEENSARASYYSIFSTPRVFFNGTSGTSVPVGHRFHAGQPGRANQPAGYPGNGIRYQPSGR